MQTRKLTRQQSIERNSNIRQLRGMLPRLLSLVPADILSQLDQDRINIIKQLFVDIQNKLDEAKQNKFTCSNCNDTTNQKPTRNKQAWKCDFCKQSKWNTPNEQLFIYKSQSVQFSSN